MRAGVLEYDLLPMGENVSRYRPDEEFYGGPEVIQHKAPLSVSFRMAEVVASLSALSCDGFDR